MKRVTCYLLAFGLLSACDPVELQPTLEQASPNGEAQSPAEEAGDDVDETAAESNALPDEEFPPPTADPCADLADALAEQLNACEGAECDWLAAEFDQLIAGCEAQDGDTSEPPFPPFPGGNDMPDPSDDPCTALVEAMTQQLDGCQGEECDWIAAELEAIINECENSSGNEEPFPGDDGGDGWEPGNEDPCADLIDMLTQQLASCQGEECDWIAAELEAIVNECENSGGNEEPYPPFPGDDGWGPDNEPTSPACEEVESLTEALSQCTGVECAWIAEALEYAMAECNGDGIDGEYPGDEPGFPNNDPWGFGDDDEPGDTPWDGDDGEAPDADPCADGITSLLDQMAQCAGAECEGIAEELEALLAECSGTDGDDDGWPEDGGNLPVF